MKHLRKEQIPEMLLSDDDDILDDILEDPNPPPPPPSPSATPTPSPCEKEGGECVATTSTDSLIGALDKVWQPRDLVWAVHVHHLPCGPKTFILKGRAVAVHDAEVTVKWATDKNHKKVTTSEVHEKEAAAWVAFYKAQMSSSPSSAKGTRSRNCDTSSEPALFPKSVSQDGDRIAQASQPAPLPSPTPQETPTKVPPPPQQETQGALVPIQEEDVEVFQNGLVVKVGWRAYLVPLNYGGNLDCDQATCTQLVKCRGGTEVVIRCLDARNRILQSV